METTKLSPATSKVIDNLIDNVLNNENFSWEKTWKNIATGNSPYNPISKNVYSGFNNFILHLYSGIKGCNQFATFKQIQSKKGTITGGKGCGIPLLFFCWKWFDPETKKTYDKNQLNYLPETIKNRLTKFPFNSNFWVFSLTDTDMELFETPKIEIKNTPIEKCENIVKNWVCDIKIGIDNSRAYYSPLTDHINMPHLQAFKGTNEYYMTMFHEISHSTGIKNRLNRDMSGMFGNNKYAKEELVAELSSIMVGANMNILTDEIIKNATAYLKSWTKKMSDKKNDLYTALTQSLKAYEYIIKVGE